MTPHTQFHRKKRLRSARKIKPQRGLCLKILSNLSSIFVSGKSLRRTTKFDTISDNFCPILSNNKSNHIYGLLRIVMYGSVQSRSG
ncbi:hypothetical protein ACE6H2_007194 [Prunus campanulata]